MMTEQYVGRVLDRRYQILEHIGSGGMSLLFRAVHVGTGRPLAVKILRDKFRDNVDFVRRFQREAWLTAKLKHENIVDIFDVQTEEECYLVMELLVGVDLQRHLRQAGRLPWTEVRAIALQICDALQFAHEHGVVHRDLKPANCFRLEASGRIKVLDLGIAKPMAPILDDHERITMTGHPLGTPAYMAPEQFMGQADARSDVYSVGVLIFELLTGQRPFRGKDAELLQQIVNLPMPSIASVAQDLDCPPGIEAVLTRALAKLPEGRHTSMRALADAIVALDVETPKAVETQCNEATGLQFEAAMPAISDRSDDPMDEPTIAVHIRVPVTPAEPDEEPPEGAALAVVVKHGPAPTPESSRWWTVGRIAGLALVCAVGIVLLWLRTAADGVAESTPPSSLAVGAPGASDVNTADGSDLTLTTSEPAAPPPMEVLQHETPDVNDMSLASSDTQSPDEPPAGKTERTYEPSRPPVRDVKRNAVKTHSQLQHAARREILKVLLAENVANYVPRVKVTVRWSDSGDVTEATVDGLSNGPERAGVEARLRALPAPSGSAGRFSFEETFELPSLE